MAEAKDAHLPLAEAAYQHLLADIIACRLQPGERITERSLVKATGYGASPIRDALTRLDHDGLVRTIPRKGYQVAPLTLKVVDDLFTFWQIIGPEVVRRGVTAATDEQLDRIIKNMNDIEDAVPHGNTREELARFTHIANDLFTTLAEASGNSYLVAAYAKLSGELLRVWTLVAKVDHVTPARVTNVSDWGAIIRSRDGDAMACNAQQYIQASHDYIAQVLLRWPSVRTSEVMPLST